MLGAFRRSVVGVVLVFGLLAAAPASADEYDAKYAGHPLRIIAYVVHPIGVFLDYVLLRPIHWVGSHEPMKTIFGHTDD